MKRLAEVAEFCLYMMDMAVAATLAVAFTHGAYV